jgi:hypothetical protein
VRTTRPEVLPRLQSRLPPGCVPLDPPVVDLMYSLVAAGEPTRPGVRYFHVLYGPLGRIIRTTNLEDALVLFEQDLMTLVGAYSNKRLIMHAGAVGISGRAIVFPGASSSGKSHLVAALLRAGATLFSDEYTLIDAAGRVHPFKRPVQFKDTAAQKALSGATDELSTTWSSKPLPVQLIVMTHYKPGVQFRPRAVSPGNAVLEVLPHTLRAIHRPREAVERLLQLVSAIKVVKSARPDADEVASKIIRLLSTRPAPVRAGPGGSAHATSP